MHGRIRILLHSSDNKLTDDYIRRLNNVASVMRTFVCSLVCFLCLLEWVRCLACLPLHAIACHCMPLHSISQSQFIPHQSSVSPTLSCILSNTISDVIQLHTETSNGSIPRHQWRFLLTKSKNSINLINRCIQRSI